MLKLSRSEKDYIEAIYILARRMGSVRSIDVANYLEHSKPSVTKTVKNLCAKGYLKKIDHDLIFTELGKSVAENIFERHCILTRILMTMGIDKPAAVKDAQ